MAKWKVGNVQRVEMHGQTRDGFVVQEVGRSPSLTFAFPDHATATECAQLMQRILDKASAVAGAA